MSVRTRPGGNIFHYEFEYKTKRYQGSTGQTDRSAALVYEAEVRRLIKASSAYAADQAASTAATSKSEANPAAQILTVGELAELVNAVKQSQRGKPLQFERDVSAVATEMGLDLPITEVTKETVSRLIMAESIKVLVQGARNLKEPVVVEDVLNKARIATDGKRLSFLEIGKLYEKLKKQAAADTPPRTPLRSGTIKRSILDPVFALLKYARDVKGTPLPVGPKRSDFKYNPYKRTRILSFRDQRELSDVARPDTWSVWEFAIWSMLRKNNILKLTWNQVDLEGGVIKLTQKGGGQVTKRINPVMRRILEQERKAGHHKRYVFTFQESIRTGKDTWERTEKRRCWTYGSCHRLWGGDLKKAKIDGLTFHDLRRTGATRLYAATKDIEVVMKALGHSSPDITWNYIGFREGDEEAAELQRTIYENLETELAEMKANGVESDMTLGEENLVVAFTVATATAPAAALRKIAQHRPDLAPKVRSMVSPEAKRSEASEEGGRSGSSRQTVHGAPVSASRTLKLENVAALSDRGRSAVGSAAMRPHGQAWSRNRIQPALAGARPARTSDPARVSYERRPRFYSDECQRRLYIDPSRFPGVAIDDEFVFRRRPDLPLERIGEIVPMLEGDPFWLDVDNIRVLINGRAGLKDMCGCAQFDHPIGMWAVAVRTELSGARLGNLYSEKGKEKEAT